MHIAYDVYRATISFLKQLKSKNYKFKYAARNVSAHFLELSQQRSTGLKTGQLCLWKKD